MNKTPSKAFRIIYPGIRNVLISPIAIQSPKDQKIIQTMAIWDTGATNSVITTSVCEKLGIAPMGKRMVKGIHQTAYANTFLITMILQNVLTCDNILVTECDKLSPNGELEVLIGMDIISRGDFAISNFEGKTVFSFRVPSIAVTDYVREENVRRAVEQKTVRPHYQGGKKNKKRGR